MIASPLIRRRSRRAAGTPSSGRVRAATSLGLERSRLPEASATAHGEQPDLDQDRDAVAGLPERVDRRHVDDRRPGAGGQQDQDRRQRDGREARDHHAQRRHAAALADAEPEDQQPDQAAEPERARDQVQPVERDRQPARGGLPGVADRARDEQHRHRRERGPDAGGELGDRAQRSLGAVHPQRDPGGARRTARSRSPCRRSPRPNAVTRYSGTSAPRSNTERSESLAIEKSR